MAHSSPHLETRRLDEFGAKKIVICLCLCDECKDRKNRKCLCTDCECLDKKPSTKEIR